MADYISRNKAAKVLCMACGNAACDPFECSFYKEMEDIPAADVRPVVRGHWEWDENGMDWGLGAWKCSECKAIPQTWWNADKENPLRCSGSRFCGNCGADMRKVVEIDQVKEAET